MKPDDLTIDVKYVDGPFKHLDNRWHFTELTDNSCEVSFFIDYELNSKVLAMAAGTVFEMAFGKFVSAFEDQANKVYGAKI